MANNFENGYASKYTGEIDKLIVQTAKTGFLADNAFKAKFVGSKTVYLPEISMEGMGTYSRTGGYPKSDTTLTYTPYTLSQERGAQLFIDAQDADESGVPDLVGKMVGEFTRTQAVPEIDAYILSALYKTAAASADTNIVAYAAETAVKGLLQLINNAEAAMEYDGGTSLVAMVDPTLYNLLMTSNELQRFITVSDFKQGEINLKVKNLNGCSIIPVSASRMKSDYNFSDKGFTAADGAQDVRAIVLPKDSASFVKKVDKVDVLNPSQVEDYDAYKINFRMYYDLIVKNSRKKTIFAMV